MIADELLALLCARMAQSGRSWPAGTVHTMISRSRAPGYPCLELRGVSHAMAPSDELARASQTGRKRAWQLHHVYVSPRWMSLASVCQSIKWASFGCSED